MSEAIHQILRWTHIAIGFTILVVFWIPVLSKKGGRLHIAAGKVYVALGEGENPDLYSFVYCLNAGSGDVNWIYCTCKYDEKTDKITPWTTT